MKKLAFVLVSAALSLCLCACKSDIISLSEAVQLDENSLNEKLEDISRNDIMKAWGEPYSEIEYYADVFSLENDAVVLYYFPEERVHEVRKCFWCYGRYFRDKNGNDMMLIEQNGYTEPVCVSPYDVFSFDEYEDGDRLGILVECIAETYPAQAEVCWAELTEKGSFDDLDADVMAQLREMGWAE